MNSTTKAAANVALDLVQFSVIDVMPAAGYPSLAFGNAKGERQRQGRTATLPWANAYALVNVNNALAN